MLVTQDRPRPDPAPSTSAAGLFHLSAMYAVHESGPLHVYSGSRARSEAVLSEARATLGIPADGVVRVRMRSPFRPSGGRLGLLLELRPSVPSALTRAPLGALGMTGAKWPLALMDYAGNGFDSRPLAESLAGRRRCVALCDGLAAFAYLGWQ